MIGSMSQREENDLIAEALRSRTEAKRKLKLLRDHLHNLARRLRMLADELSPQDAKEPRWDMVRANLGMSVSSSEVFDVLDMAKIRASIDELLALEQTVADKSATLREYGAE